MVAGKRSGSSVCRTRFGCSYLTHSISLRGLLEVDLETELEDAGIESAGMHQRWRSDDLAGNERRPGRRGGGIGAWIERGDRIRAGGFCDAGLCRCGGAHADKVTAVEQVRRFDDQLGVDALVVVVERPGKAGVYLIDIG